MSKIVAGQAGGLPLKSVPGDNTRPTTERTKEALFSWLESRDWIASNAVLDLYTGSGGLAVEAASRGAATVTGVDQARSAVRVAQANAEKVNEALGRAVVKIQQMPVQRFVQATAPHSWDLVLADPPYDLDGESLMTTIQGAFEVLMDDGLFVLERPTKAQEPAWLEDTYVVDARKYGESTVYFVRRRGH